MLRQTVSMFQSSDYIRYVKLITVKTRKVNIVSVSLHRAHSLQVTKDQDVEAKAVRNDLSVAKGKATIFCLDLSLIEVEDSPHQGSHFCLLSV